MMVVMRTAVRHSAIHFLVGTAIRMSLGCGTVTAAGANVRLMGTGTRVGMVPAATENAVDQHHGEHQSLHNPRHGKAFQNTSDDRLTGTHGVPHRYVRLNRTSADAVTRPVHLLPGDPLAHRVRPTRLLNLNESTDCLRDGTRTGGRPAEQRIPA